MEKITWNWVKKEVKIEVKVKKMWNNALKLLYSTLKVKICLKISEKTKLDEKRKKPQYL